MGLFTASKRKSRKGRGSQRREPQLFAGKVPERAEAKALQKSPRRRRSLLVSLLSFCFTLSIWGLVAGGLGIGYVWLTLDKKGLLHIPEREPGMMILAEDGNILAERGAFFGDEVRMSELPDYVPNAIVAIEDRRFRSHMGVDPYGLARAIVQNLRAGHVVQGGSTLTQQLAKNLFLKPERTIERKVQEMVLAVWLETKFSKDELLQLYMNRVYFGGGAIGIEKAAQKFFGRSARDVTLQQAAILAAVLKAPTDYNPLQHPDAAADRARLVLSAMETNGFIDREEAQAAIDSPLKVKASDYVPATQYVIDWVSESLPDLVKKYDSSIIIETTIDPVLQAKAEKALRKRLNEDGAKLAVTQGALVIMDTSGAVKAMVGGKSYVKSQFNRVTKAKRQPGSAFKPFVYLTAIEQGASPDSVEIDEPVKIGDWEPENYRRKYLGPVSLTKALSLSLNTIAAKLAYNAGPANVAETAHRLGITSTLAPNASIALGTSEVTLLELTSAFAPFANGGAPVAPYIVKRITTRSGDVIYERHGDGLGRAIAPGDLGAMNQMMRAVVTSGTARRAQFGNFEIGGKTGTSQDYRDAWFIGYTSYLVGGVWAGNDDNSPTKKVTGGSIPAAIWRDVMEPAHSGFIPMPLPGERRFAGAEPQAVIPDQDPVPQIEPPPRKRTADAGPEDSQDGGGILDTIFGGDKRKKPAAPPGQRKKTAFEKMQERQRENSGSR